MELLLTVVIPVYNGEKYVRRAVQSVLSQPEAKLTEVLLVDDGSTDGSGFLCDRLAAENANVRVIHKENGGVSSARNLGLEKAHGKYICFLDCDDWWEPDVFDCAVAESFSSCCSPDVYQFSYREVNSPVTLEKRYLCEDSSVVYDGPGFGRYDWSPHCSFIFSRKLLLDKGVRYLMCKVGEDGPMVEMALFHARSFRRCSKVLYSYWENPASCVHTTSILCALEEQCKGIAQKKQYFETFKVSFDAEESTIWQILTALPKLCAYEPYSTVQEFMEEYCMSILEGRPDIHINEPLQRWLDAWRAKPRRYWLIQKVKVGLPMGIKNLLLRIPGMQKHIGYLYTRYHRKFLPIVK